MAGIFIGTSGWLYPPWRGTFYPRGLPQRRELEYLAGQLGSAEINGSFYSLQRPERYRWWAEQAPENFVFSVKGSRFITHMKRLRDVEVPLANFFASGVLALGGKLGPLLWQLPATTRFDPERLAEFFDLLPRGTAAAAELAGRHDERLRGRALTETDADRPLRYALEARHPSFATEECVDLLRAHDIALVAADTAGTWPRMDDVTSDFCYVRLHGAEELYAGGYTAEALDDWADLVRAWHAGKSPTTPHTAADPAPRKDSGRDVHVYFDNDIKAHAPFDAQGLMRRCGVTHTA